MDTNVNSKRRFLFVLFEGGGNVPPMLGLARRLVEGGHSVRVIGEPANEAEIRAVGCEFSPYTRAPHRFDKSAESTFMDDYVGKSSVQALFRFIDKVLAGPALEYAQDVLEELQARPVDLVVVNEFLFGGLFAAEKLGIPSVMVTPGTYNFYAPNFPPPGMTPLGGPLGWLRDKFYGKMFGRLLAHALPGLKRARQGLGLSEGIDVLGYLDQLERILVLTTPAFEFMADFAPNMLYTGPIIDDPVLVEPWQSPWPQDDARPLVVVSFSTTYQKHEAILQRVINAFSDLPVRALVTVGPAIDAQRLTAPPNVVLRAFVSHAQVFPHASAVITHAGHGTVIRALAQGVPLICMPVGRDQPNNAARVVARGAGIRLSPAAETKAIRQAVQTLLADGRYRQNARKLADAIQKDAHSTAAISELERIASREGRQSAAPSTSTAPGLTWQTEMSTHS
ncbi:MAG: glycosyltransferase family 1 protein [Anaerolineae bacterium]|nr:glycosyltransferase family 1 protein [Anaerolineae bacterium]